MMDFLNESESCECYSIVHFLVFLFLLTKSCKERFSFALNHLSLSLRIHTFQLSIPEYHHPISAQLDIGDKNIPHIWRICIEVGPDRNATLVPISVLSFMIKQKPETNFSVSGRALTFVNNNGLPYFFLASCDWVVKTKWVSAETVPLYDYKFVCNSQSLIYSVIDSHRRMLTTASKLDQR